MSEQQKHLKFVEGAGKLPAWVWRSIADMQRQVNPDEVAVAVLKDGSDRFVLIDARDWDKVIDRLQKE